MLRHFIPVFLLSVLPAVADPVISEFLASNQNSIVDEDGSNADWIEIRNPDATPVSLNGWFLTDLITNKSKWTFPNVTLPGNSYLIVWASGKDRRVAGQPLHANFNLSAGGEYLALVKPDGATVTTEFTPVYPAQFADISYGTSTNSNDVTLIDKPTAARAFVPADNVLGTTWRARTFDDSAWLPGTFAVGFMNTGANPNLQADLGIDLKALVPSIIGSGRSAYARAHFTIANPGLVTKLTLKANYDDGFYAWINADFVANSPSAPAEGALVFNSPAGQIHAPGAFETTDISSKISSLLAGDNVLALQALNANTTSSDLFMWPQLIASIDTGGPGVTGYFSVGTPGVANGGPNTIQLPISVTASRAPGTFTALFNLTLGGATAGKEIRYVISDPSGSGAMLADPTVASTLYSAPIPIATSKLIRAAVFDSANGQKGRTTTLQYLLLETGGVNNTSNFTSNLPILVVDDHGAGEPVDGASGLYTQSLFHVFDTVAGTASMNAAPVIFSRAGTRVRGSSSSGFPKKSYGLETRDEVEGDRDIPLLGMASDSDWVLNGPWLFDDTFIHNSFINEISRQCGRWASRTRFVEMFVNTNGGKLDYADYAGVYVATEKIKSNNNRVDIAALEPGDNSGNAVTGGYIMKVDRNDPDEVTWTTTGGVGLVLVEPDPQVDTPQQISYIQGYTQTFDTTLTNERNANFTTRNYRTYMDTAAWVDHHILNSIAYNVDALRLSAYFFKDRGERINAGPIWDFDRALGSDDGRDANPSSWVNIEYFFTLGWWGHVFRDPDFVQAWVDRWQQLRAGPLAQANLNAVADAQGVQIGNAAGARDAAKWPDNAAAGGVYLNEITAMKTWLTTRANWINGQMPAPPATATASGIVSAGTNVTLSGSGGTIRYTLNGTDPRPEGGGTPGSGTAYGGALPITQTTVLTARRQLPTTTTVFAGQGAIGINWSGPLTRVYLVNEFFATLGDIAVSEMNFNPLAPTMAESTVLPGITSADFEFVEIRNIGARVVNLFEVRLPETKPFKELKLAPFTLNPGDRALVVKNRAAFELRYGTAQSAKIVGEWIEGSLDDNGELIELRARDNTLIQAFTYNDAGLWPGRADGKGSTLEYSGVTFADVDFNNGVNWRSSSEFHGSPGIAGAGPDNAVTINEVLNNTALPYVDAIELINNTGASVDLSGWYLSNRRSVETGDDYKQFRIPNGTTIAVGGYLVFNETDFNPNGAWNPTPGVPGAGEFSFDGNHDNEAWLFQADAGGKLLKFVDHVDVGAARLNESWGRRPNGTGALYPMAQRTCYNEASGAVPKAKLGAPNSAPRVGPLIISEVHHSPAGANTDLEFVELRNPTGSAQSLALWRLRGDVDFDFTTESIPAGGLLVIVPFVPSDPVKAPAFRAAFSISNSVPLAGPWQSPDQLGVPGNVTLYRAGTPPPLEPGFSPLTIEDQTDYASGGAWPATTGGLSLNRRGTATFGIDAANWLGDIPSPGTTGPSYAQWKAFYFPAGGPGSGDADDPDFDSSSNAREYGLGGNPLTFEPQPPLLPALTTQPGAGDATNYIFTFTKPLTRPGTTYFVESTTNFIAWQIEPDTLVSATTEFETRRAIVTVPAGTPRLFFHLRIEIAP